MARTGENYRRREQRTPLGGGGVVGRCAAYEFEAAIQMSDDTGAAKGCKGFAGHPLKPGGFFNFQADSMTGW
jgi:hypothetical protein